MNSYRDIYGWICEMIDIFPDIKFKYLYNSDRKVHYIAVYPYSLSDDDEYCELENNFFLDLLSNYKKERFVFGVESNNFKITQDFCEFYKGNIPEYIENLQCQKSKMEYNNHIFINTTTYVDVSELIFKRRNQESFEYKNISVLTH